MTGCLGINNHKVFLSDFALKDDLEFGGAIVVGVGIFLVSDKQRNHFGTVYIWAGSNNANLW